MHRLHRGTFRSTRQWIRTAAVVVAASLFTAGSFAVAADDKPAADKGAAGEEQITYAKHIQPILRESCVQCHRAPQVNANRGPGGPGGAGGQPGGRRAPGGAPGGGAGGGGGRPRGPAGGLRLDDKAAILKGGKHGKALVPGKGDESLLYRVLKEPVKIDSDEIHAMPKARPNQEFTPIADDEIGLIKKWIDQGAK